MSSRLGFRDARTVRPCPLLSPRTCSMAVRFGFSRRARSQPSVGREVPPHPDPLPVGERELARRRHHLTFSPPACGRGRGRADAVEARISGRSHRPSVSPAVTPDLFRGPGPPAPPLPGFPPIVVRDEPGPRNKSGVTEGEDGAIGDSAERCGDPRHRPHVVTPRLVPWLSGSDFRAGHDRSRLSAGRSPLTLTLSPLGRGDSLAASSLTFSPPACGRGWGRVGRSIRTAATRRCPEQVRA